MLKVSRYNSKSYFFLFERRASSNFQRPSSSSISFQPPKPRLRKVSAPIPVFSSRLERDLHARVVNGAYGWNRRAHQAQSSRGEHLHWQRIDCSADSLVNSRRWRSVPCARSGAGTMISSLSGETGADGQESKKRSIPWDLSKSSGKAQRQPKTDKNVIGTGSEAAVQFFGQTPRSANRVGRLLCAPTCSIACGRSSTAAGRPIPL